MLIPKSIELTARRFPMGFILISIGPKIFGAFTEKPSFGLSRVFVAFSAVKSSKFLKRIMI